jgi:hypothetical protein
VPGRRSAIRIRGGLSARIVKAYRLPIEPAVTVLTVSRVPALRCEWLSKRPRLTVRARDGGTVVAVNGHPRPLHDNTTFVPEGTPLMTSERQAAGPHGNVATTLALATQAIAVAAALRPSDAFGRWALGGPSAV